MLCADEHRQDGRWGGYCAQLLNGTMRTPRAVRHTHDDNVALLALSDCFACHKGSNNDNAHPPIYPTRWSGGEASWSPAKASLYEFVCRHFLACVSPDAAGDQTTVTAQLAGEEFSTNGLMIRDMCVTGVLTWHLCR
jgi:DNA topoisomerase IA